VSWDVDMSWRGADLSPAFWLTHWPLPDDDVGGATEAGGEG
jgi:hypothetical protein